MKLHSLHVDPKTDTRMAHHAVQLRRILELERSKGYEDRAVIGGLDKFLRQWLGPVQQTISDSQLEREFKKLFIQATYSKWDKEQRQKWIDKVLVWLAQNETSLYQQDKITPAASTTTSLQKTRRELNGSSPPLTSHISPPGSHLSLDSPVSELAGIGPALASKFEKLGVKSVRNLIYFFPHRHLDYSQIKPIAELEVGKEQTIVATVWEARTVHLGRQKGAEAILGDETGNIRAVWFNQPYLVRRLINGVRVVLSGRISIFRGMKQFDSPEWELIEDSPGIRAVSGKELIHTGRLVPVYPLTQGLTIKRVRQLVKEALDRWVKEVPEYLPSVILERCGLLGLHQAIHQAHYPDNQDNKEAARRRLAFNELFILQLGLLSQKWKWQESQPGNAFLKCPEIVERFLSSLSFPLTQSQNRVIEEIMADMASPKPMSRLLQGEVGSGKTVVATIALLVTTANNYQGALMAPTEILAEQHLATLRKLFSGSSSKMDINDDVYSFEGLLSHPLRIAMLTGNLRSSGKRGLQNLLRDGKIDIIIGTHALIQKGVEIPRLGLAVVDEQHRFGVSQRWELRQKGFNPHILVMTATPIPRTLALTLYGDLELSVIDQLPPGRQEIKTRWLGPEKRNSAYAFVRNQVAEGRQAFIICPLIEESEAIEARAATVEYERLSRVVFPDLRLGLLHGRMPGAEKEDVMRRFRNGELQILISTPVVEVGIDIPNATVMLVEGADRFGMSQLHQFRGRVGRGDKTSYCILVADNPSLEGRERLAIIEKVKDGFVLAEEDMKLRGPGEFFGTRQSGLPDLRMAKLSDAGLLEMARREAKKLFEEDPDLARKENNILVNELGRLWKSNGEGS